MPARAAIIEGTFAFSASQFTNSFNEVTGSVTLSFDTAGGGIANRRTGITLNSLNFALGSAIGFTYFASVDRLLIGGMLNGVNGVNAGTQDFVLAIDSVSTAPTFRSLVEARRNRTTTGRSTTGQVTFTPTAIAVPEPSTPLLLATGLAALAALGLAGGHAGRALQAVPARRRQARRTA